MAVVQTKTKFTVTDKLLQKHFGYLYTELEPREIADEMFQAGHFTVFDHDNVTDLPNRYKRLKFFLKILKTKHLYADFLEILESMNHTSVLETLRTEQPLWHEPCKFTQFSIFKLNAKKLESDGYPICNTCYKVISSQVLLIQVVAFQKTCPTKHFFPI